MQKMDNAEQAGDLDRKAAVGNVKFEGFVPKDFCAWMRSGMKGNSPGVSAEFCYIKDARSCQVL